MAGWACNGVQDASQPITLLNCKFQIDLTPKVRHGCSLVKGMFSTQEGMEVSQPMALRDGHAKSRRVCSGCTCCVQVWVYEVYDAFGEHAHLQVLKAIPGRWYKTGTNWDHIKFHTRRIRTGTLSDHLWFGVRQHTLGGLLLILLCGSSLVVWNLRTIDSSVGQDR